MIRLQFIIPFVDKQGKTERKNENLPHILAE